MNPALVIYPYTRSYTPFLKAEKRGESAVFHEEILLSPHGLGMDGKDAGQIDLRDNTGVVVRSDHDHVLAKCDALLVPDGEYGDAMKKGIMHRVKDFVESGRSVYYYALWDDEVRQVLGEYRQDPIDKDLLRHPDRLYRPDASVIFVGELFGSVNGADVALALHAHFRGKEYRVSTILAPRVARFFGLHTAEEVFPPGIERAEQRIDYISNYFERIGDQENPEIVIVQIPGGMIPINDVVTNEYGIYAYMLSQAIKPDIFVLCSPLDRFNSAMFDRFSSSFSSKFGFAIDAIHMSNAQPNAANMASQFALDWTYVPLARVDEAMCSENLHDLAYPMYCALRQRDQGELCAHVEELLSQMGAATMVHVDMR